jgi:hypothetical protein
VVELVPVGNPAVNPPRLHLLPQSGRGLAHSTGCACLTGSSGVSHGSTLDHVPCREYPAVEVSRHGCPSERVALFPASSKSNLIRVSSLAAPLRRSIEHQPNQPALHCCEHRNRRPATRHRMPAAFPGHQMGQKTVSQMAKSGRRRRWREIHAGPSSASTACCNTRFGLTERRQDAKISLGRRLFAPSRLCVTLFFNWL